MLVNLSHFVPSVKLETLSFLLSCLVHFITQNRLSCSFSFLASSRTLSPLSVPFKSFYLSSFHSLHTQEVFLSVYRELLPLASSSLLLLLLSIHCAHPQDSPFPQLPVSMLNRIQPFSNPSYHRAPPLISPSPSLSRPLITIRTSSSL